MARTVEEIARQARGLITSDDESVWLDLPQIADEIEPALTAFYEAKIKDESFRRRLRKRKIEFDVDEGEVEIPASISDCLEYAEMFVGDWTLPVEILDSRAELNQGSIADCLFLSACREDDLLILGEDSVGAFGGGTISGVEGYFLVPDLRPDITKTPTAYIGEFIAFLADWMKEQISKRA